MIPNSVKGALKSITMWCAAALVVGGQVAPFLPTLLAQAGLNGSTVEKVSTVAGIAMALCRIITKGSLADKVNGGVSSPPTIQPPPTP